MPASYGEGSPSPYIEAQVPEVVGVGLYHTGKVRLPPTLKRVDQTEALARRPDTGKVRLPPTLKRWLGSGSYGY